VDELYSLDDTSTGPTYGLIFLFKWRKEEDVRATDVGCDPELFFAQQVIANACATQALLSILLNVEDENVDIGDELKNFRNFTTGMPPDVRGQAISNMETVRLAHNSFMRPEPLIQEQSSSTGTEDVFHFIAYLPFRGKIYELDGLKEGPILLGDVAEAASWVDAVRPHIQDRIQRYAQSEIRFNLMSVARDQRLDAQEKVEATDHRIEILERELEGEDTVMEDTAYRPVDLDDDDGFGVLLSLSNKEAMMTQLALERRRKEELVQELEMYEKKHDNWRLENIRRKHNYIPLCVAQLKILAREKALGPLIEAALKRQEERRAEQAASSGKS